MNLYRKQNNFALVCGFLGAPVIKCRIHFFLPPFVLVAKFYKRKKNHDKIDQLVK